MKQFRLKFKCAYSLILHWCLDATCFTDNFVSNMFISCKKQAQKWYLYNRHVKIIHIADEVTWTWYLLLDIPAPWNKCPQHLDVSNIFKHQSYIKQLFLNSQKNDPSINRQWQDLKQVHLIGKSALLTKIGKPSTLTTRPQHLDVSNFFEHLLTKCVSCHLMPFFYFEWFLRFRWIRLTALW